MQLGQRGLALDEHLLDDTEIIDRVQERAYDKNGDIDILPALIGAQHEVPFAEKTAGRRNPDHRENGQYDGDARYRHFFIETAQTIQVDFTEAVGDAADDEEQTAFHKGVVDEMENRADEAVDIADGHADGDITELRHRRVGQHTAKIVLRQRHHRTDQDAADSHNSESVRQRFHDRVPETEHIEKIAQHGVSGNLAHASGDETRRAGMGIGIGVRLPAVQRKQRHFNAERDEKARHRKREQRRVNKGLNAHADVGHI